MKLKTLKAQFEKRTEGGLEYKILEYKTGALYPIKSALKTKSCDWIIISHKDNGEYAESSEDKQWNLVLKPRIEQSQVEPGVYFEHVGEGKYVARKP